MTRGRRATRVGGGRRALAAIAALGLSALAPHAGAAPRVELFDARGARVDGVKVQLELPHSPPTLGDDPDAYRVVVVGDEAPPTVEIVARPAPSPERPGAARSGAKESALDRLELALGPAPCPAALGPEQALCWQSAPFRLALDAIDREHPLAAGRALVAGLGDVVTLKLAGDGASARFTVEGPAGRGVAKLKVRLLRASRPGPDGAPGALPIGGSAGDALRMAQGEVARAATIWGACGIALGEPPARAGGAAREVVSVVDPPPPSLLAVGCDSPAPAVGGAFSLLVEGKEVRAAIAPGTTPRGAARVLAAAIERAGFSATVSDNRASHATGARGADVIVRRAGGALATVASPKRGALSSDPALSLCIGRVDLEDGLSHFTDATALAGTLEERALVKAFDDGDPATIEVFVVPSFAGDGRIGESFIFLEGGAIRNVVIEDRAGFRAQHASFTLAHELGHVLLDQPGHPDDFGSDTSTFLMDADAVDGTAFGPRRLSREECARAFRQSRGKGSAEVLRP